MKTERLPSLRLATVGVLMGTLAACGGQMNPVEVAAAPPPAPAPAPEPPPRVTLLAVLGGSTAAGYKGYGIDAASQTSAYPMLVGTAASSDLRLPLLADPGCPAPATAPGFAPAAEGVCALQAPAGLVENLAVPGARVVDALDKRPAPSQYETLVLGARTQVAALTALAPRFAIVDLGSEDVLQPVVNDSLGTGGAEPDLLNVGVFEARYSRVVDALAVLPSLQGAVLVGAVDPVRYLPAWQVGAYYFLARDAATGRFRGVPVNTNCSPLTNPGQPNPLANNLVPISVTWSGAAEINCDPAAATHGLVTTAEQAVISARVAAYNATIQAAAAARNWAFVNPDTLLQAQSALTAAGRYQVIRRCQLLATAATPAQFQAAVLNSCPVTGPTAAPGGFYGSFFSTDGIHPATAGQALLAGAVAAAINARYGTTLPTTY